MVRTAGLEPARVAPLPPQSSVYAYFTTSAYKHKAVPQTPFNYALTLNRLADSQCLLAV